MFKTLASRIAYDVRAALDPQLPSTRTIKKFLVENTNEIPFTVEPPPGYGDSEGTYFSFYDHTTPYYVTIDPEQAHVAVQKYWTDDGVKAVIPFSEIVK